MIIILTNCRSRKRAVELKNINRVESIKVDSNIVETKKDTIIVVKEIEKESEKQINNNDGEIVIKGKSDSIKSFDFHNIVKGDTLSSIHISGNATFEIKNKWKEEKEIQSEKSIESDLNLVSRIARKSVSQKTINKVSEKAKSIEKKVNASGFQAPIYIILGVVLLIAVVLFILIKQFKK